VDSVLDPSPTSLPDLFYQTLVVSNPNALTRIIFISWFFPSISAIFDLRFVVVFEKSVDIWRSKKPTSRQLFYPIQGYIL